MKADCIRQCVGVDMSKNDFSVCFVKYTTEGKTIIKGTKKFLNTTAGFNQFIKWTDKKSTSDLQTRVVVEATGCYHETFAYFIRENTDYYLSVELPTKTKAFAKSLNVKTKTDKSDAKVLAQIGVERLLREWKPMSPQLLTLRQLNRHKERLQENKNVVFSQLHAHLHSYRPNKKVTAQLKSMLRVFDNQIKVITDLIKDTVALDEELQSRIDKVCKIKGIRLPTAAAIIAETGGFALFTSRAQLISYAGYDVVERDSGTSVRGKTRISKKGNRHIRRALYLPAMTASRYEPCCIALSERIKERTKIPMKANVAVQRKLLVLIYTIFKNNVEFDSHYQQRKTNENKEPQKV